MAKVSVSPIVWMNFQQNTFFCREHDKYQASAVYADIHIRLAHYIYLFFERHVCQIDRLPCEHITLHKHSFKLLLVGKYASNILFRRALSYTQGKMRHGRRRGLPQVVGAQHALLVGPPERTSSTLHGLLFGEGKCDKRVHVCCRRFQVEDKVLKHYCLMSTVECEQILKIHKALTTVKGALY